MAFETNRLSVAKIILNLIALEFSTYNASTKN